MKKNLIKLIDEEIVWCMKKENRTMPEDYMKGFVKGLKQAKLLVKKVVIKK
jgi:hypothetical protein